MAKNFIFNMGYDTTHIISVLTREGLSEGSKIVLVIPGKSDERQKNAVDDIESYLDKLSFDASLEVFPAGESFDNDFLEISNLLSSLENIYLSLSGGSRDLLIPMTLAACFSSEEIEEIFFRSDIDSELKTLDMPHASVELSRSELAVLKETNVKKAVSEIFASTEFTESTIYNAVSDLEEKGLLQSEKESSKTNYKITNKGKIFREKSSL